MSKLEQLYASLQKRLRPEDVAELILDELSDDLSTQERRLLDKAAQHSLKRGLHKFSSMVQDFYRPDAPLRKVKKAQDLFSNPFMLTDEECHDPQRVSEFIRYLSGEIQKSIGENNFKVNRLSRLQRSLAGLDISKRRYNKLFRFLCRFEQKLSKYQFEIRKYNATRIAKSGLSTMISRNDFVASRDAACFVAYYTAARNRRSVFTNKRQKPAFDDIAAFLLERARKTPSPGGWRAIAQVFPDADIITELRNEDKLALLTVYLAQLEDLSSLLRTTWEKNDFDRQKMIVRRGNDSSTWNALAGAWNTARLGWLALGQALGMDEMIDNVCPGKVMRLMAADVAWWHMKSRTDLDPDTCIWAELPFPWEVFSGEASCTRQDVERVCKRHGVAPELKGWTAAHQGRVAVRFTPTPELVHGVVVDHPGLAILLRKAGWFSGKV